MRYLIHRGYRYRRQHGYLTVMLCKHDTSAVKMERLIDNPSHLASQSIRGRHAHWAQDVDVIQRANLPLVSSCCWSPINLQFLVLTLHSRDKITMVSAECFYMKFDEVFCTLIFSLICFFFCTSFEHLKYKAVNLQGITARVPGVSFSYQEQRDATTVSVMQCGRSLLQRWEWLYDCESKKSLQTVFSSFLSEKLV